MRGIPGETDGAPEKTMAKSLSAWGLSLLPSWNQAAAYAFYGADCWTGGRASSRPLPTPLGTSSPVSASRQFTVTFRDPSSDPCQHLTASIAEAKQECSKAKFWRSRTHRTFSPTALCTKSLRRIHSMCESPKPRSHPDIISARPPPGPGAYAQLSRSAILPSAPDCSSCFPAPLFHPRIQMAKGSFQNIKRIMSPLGRAALKLR